MMAKPMCLTKAGEMFLLAAHTMPPMPAFGPGCWPMVNKLVRDGLVQQAPVGFGTYVSTTAGVEALLCAGYDVRAAAP